MIHLPQMTVMVANVNCNHNFKRYRGQGTICTGCGIPYRFWSECELARLRTELDAEKAREAKLREALERVLEWCDPEVDAGDIKRALEDK